MPDQLLQADYLPSDPTVSVYAHLRNWLGQRFNTTTHLFEARNVAHWTNYSNPLTDPDTIGDWEAPAPTGLPLGEYRAIYYVQASAGVYATSDLVVGAETVRWGGTAAGLDAYLSALHGSGVWATAPVVAGSARIFGYAGPPAAPMVGVRALLTLTNPPQYAGDYSIPDGPEECLTDRRGQWEFVRPSGGTASYRITVLDDGIDKAITTWPAVDTNIKDMP